MIKGIGVDIIEIDRIKQAVEKHGENFLKKVYTTRELTYCSGTKSWRIPELAVRFAAKEAYAKAVGTGIGKGKKPLNWLDIEIDNDKLGKPMIAVKGRRSKRVQVSLSHSRDYAVAMVSLEA
jgi:holo-[acyl-carrier protein] synthase